MHPRLSIVVALALGLVLGAAVVAVGSAGLYRYYPRAMFVYNGSLDSHYETAQTRGCEPLSNNTLRCPFWIDPLH